MTSERDITDLYRRLIDGWNSSDAEAMAGTLAHDGLVIGFDGSQMQGPDAVARELGQIFADHQVARYVTKVRSVMDLGDSGAALHAVAGMVAPGGSELVPDRNAVQTVVARRAGERWEVVLFQTTPARFDGRPELAEALTAELSDLV